MSVEPLRLFELQNQPLSMIQTLDTLNWENTSENDRILAGNFLTKYLAQEKKITTKKEYDYHVEKVFEIRNNKEISIEKNYPSEAWLVATVIFELFNNIPPHEYPSDIKSYRWLMYCKDPTWTEFESFLSINGVL